MKRNNNARNILLISVFVMMAALISCKENDIKQVNKITKVDTSPTQTANNLKVDYTENGRLVYTLSSPVMKKYEKPDLVTEFPKGFNVIFYDSLQKQRGTARANYAISHDVTEILELKGNVIIVNNKEKARIETEKMFWDRRLKTIYGDRAVRIITPDKVAGGDGFKANEDLSRREILHPTSVWYVKNF